MSGVFAELEADQRQQVRLAIERAIARSFATHPPRVLTRDEVKRRFHMCARIIEQLRGDLRWGLTRALDLMPVYFETELNGSAWTPDARACWMPEDGR